MNHNIKGNKENLDIKIEGAQTHKQGKGLLVMKIVKIEVVTKITRSILQITQKMRRGFRHF